MGNAINNYEKKRRKEQKEVYKEIRRVVHDTVMARMNLPREFKEKEAEIFNQLN